MRPLELDHPNRVLADEPGSECSPAGPSDCLPRMRKTRPDITILALFRSPALRMNRTARLLSLGRTLPESRLRRLPFGILSRCQLPRPNCQRTKRADEATRTPVHGTPTARDCHGQRFAPAATLSAIRTGPRPTTPIDPADTATLWSESASPMESRAAKREPIPESLGSAASVRKINGRVRHRQAAGKNDEKIGLSGEKRWYKGFRSGTSMRASPPPCRLRKPIYGPGFPFCRPGCWRVAWLGRFSRLRG